MRTYRVSNTDWQWGTTSVRLIQCIWTDLKHTRPRDSIQLTFLYYQIEIAKIMCGRVKPTYVYARIHEPLREPFYSICTILLEAMNFLNTFWSKNTFWIQEAAFSSRVCFAMSIDKAQGQSLTVAGLYLQAPCLSHGQDYVGCSQVGLPRSLFICAPGGETRNVVYKEAL